MTAFESCKKLGLLGMALALGLFTAGCASTGAGESAGFANDAEISDPLEDYNRAVFAFNDAVDRGLVAPVARGYRAAVPQPARSGVRNFLRNLRSPVNAGNQLLQGDVRGFAADVTRFVINTSIGLGGLIDVAKTAGVEYEHEDFGQTLAVWGVGHGPYFVLPVMGPSSFRDATGLAVDTIADPVRILLHNTDNEGWYYARAVASGLDKREELLDPLDDLRRNSFDYYAAMRSAYYQFRDALVQDQKGTMTAPAIPDYDAGEQ